MFKAKQNVANSVVATDQKYLLMIFRPMYKGGYDVKSGTTTVCVAHSL